MPILPEKIRFKNSIAARLALYILIYSSIITLILTATQLYRDYRHELAGIENQFKQIRIASLPSIRHNLWVVNSRALQSQINDLHALPNMQYLEVRDEQNKPIARAGTQKDKNIIIREFPLLYLHRGKEVPIGSLHIHITLEAIYEHLLDTAIVILISQAAKTFLVSIFILFLFQWLVTRHLSTIASWAKKLDVKGIDHALVLERQERNHEQRDELDIVTSAFNEMRENLNAVYQKLQRSHDQLQDQVEERTKKLQISNQELDSFCYSVSHDLRSPLRGISGFSEILMEEYADHLDSQGRDYLMRIQKAGVRMSDLIDDLLRLSRLSQTPLRREDCNLSSMVETIITSLRHNHSQRQVEVQIEPRLHACADTSLIRVALENLLGNAWKYTAGEPIARISFSAIEQDGELAYKIEDNGAGFSNAHVDKLFQPFQRLHSHAEFEGNGIGLATVKRIIQGHGGRVWGESPGEKGASFYFTLPESSDCELQETDPT